MATAMHEEDDPDDPAFEDDLAIRLMAYAAWRRAQAATRERAVARRVNKFAAELRAQPNVSDDDAEQRIKAYAEMLSDEAEANDDFNEW